MSVTQTNVLGAVTANVIQGLADQNQFGGLKIAPGIAQNGLSVNWPVIQLAEGEMLRDNLEKRAPGSGFKRITAKINLDSSVVEGDGFEVVIDKSIATDSSKRGLDAMAVYGRELMLNAYRKNESDVSTLVQGSGFETTAALVDYTAANIATIDAAQDIQGAIETIAGRGEMADTIVIPVQAWNRIRFSDLLKGFIAGSVNPGATVTANTLQKAFSDEGIKQVIIGRARVNNAAKNKTSISTIWANTHLWVGAAAPASNGVGNTIAAAAATFYSDEQSDPFIIEQYWCDERRSYVLRVFGETNTKITNANAGQRITTSYA